MPPRPSNMREAIEELRTEIHTSAAARDANIKQLSAQIDALTTAVKELNTRLDGSDSENNPGLRLRVDRLEQNQERAKLIIRWALSIFGTIIGATALAVLDLLRKS